MTVNLKHELRLVRRLGAESKTMVGRLPVIENVIFTVSEYLDKAEPECYKRFVRSMAVHVIAFNGRLLFKYCDIRFSAIVHAV